MFADLKHTLESHLPSRRKKTPSGWISFDARCCQHQGESPDTRQRGGIMYSGDGSVNYHCFNCGFKANYTPGSYLNNRFRKLLTWLNVPTSVISKLAMKAMAISQEVNPEQKKLDNEIKFDTVKLPEDAEPIRTNSYLMERGIGDVPHTFYEAPKSMKDRVIVPIRWHNKLIGYVARATKEMSPKYIAQVQPGTLFNLDNQHWSRKFVILVEGIFDAIQIDGVAILGSEIAHKQKLQIDALNRKVIVVPDRDKAGTKLIEQAIEWGWAVSMPPWDTNVKDVNDAVQKYGRILTMQAILKYVFDSKTKIKLQEKLWI